MDSDSPIVCFQCSQPVQDPPVIHQLADGSSCKACADRVLAAQPGLFHAPPAEEPTSQPPVMRLVSQPTLSFDDEFPPEPA